MDLFVEYENINEVTIKEVYAENKEENLHLDFKLVNEGFSHDDKRNFAKALSGFANSDGGIIIWGINARKNKDGVDCSCGIVPVKSLKSCLSRLNSLTGELVSPQVNGVVHKEVSISPDCGVILTYIPASESGPHMAKGGEDRYYKRSGDSFYKMEHFDLEDMFGRGRKPALSLTYSIERGMTKTGGGNYKEAECKILLGIINTGKGVAKYPFISFVSYSGFTFSAAGQKSVVLKGFPRLFSGVGDATVKFGGNADYVIHPGTSFDIDYLVKMYYVADVYEDIMIEADYCAEGISMKRDRIVINGDTIRKVLNKDFWP